MLKTAGPDPNQPWVVAIQRQKRWMMVSVIGSVVMMFAVLALVIWIVGNTRGGLPLGPITWSVLGLIAIVGGPMILFGSLARKQRHWMEKMLQEGGLACPKCRIALTSDHQEEGQVHCRKCFRTYAAEELKQYWGDAVVNPREAAAWWLERHGDKKRLGRIALWMMPDGKPHLGRIILYQFIAWICIGSLVAGRSGSSVIVWALNLTPMFLLFSGFMLIHAGRKIRVGESLHCSRCDYEQGPDPGEKCPECGLEWNIPGGTIQGRARRKVPLIVIGSVLIILSAATMYRPFLGRNWQSKILPTNALVSEVVSKRGFTMSEWAELRTRTLSPEQQRRLATGLLDERRKKTPAWLSADEDNWFVTQIAGGTLQSDLMTRYYREMLDIQLVAPAKAKVGQAITLALRCTARGASTNNPSIIACIGGYYINDEPQPIGRKATGIAGILLDSRTAYGSFVSTDATFTTQTAGTIKVRSTVWVICVPLGAPGQTIQWQDDGMPVIPANAVWHEAREFEQIINVSD